MKLGRQIRTIVIVGLILSVTFFIPALLNAEVPHQLNYQGYLTDDIGDPLDGDYLMIFSIYDVPAGGTALWNESQGNVRVTNGIFNVHIGLDPTGNPFSADLFDGQRWLGVTVGTDDEMVPRQLLTSTPFAKRAANADDADRIDGMDSTALDQSAHVTGTNNPHSVSAVQIGAATLSDITWGNLSNIPSGFADGSDNTGIITETDPTIIDNSIKDGVSWSELSGIPIGFNDGVDNVGLTAASDYGRSGVSSTLYEGSTALTNKYVGKSGSHTITNGNLTVNTPYGTGAAAVTGVKGFAQSETYGFGVLGQANGSSGYGIYGSASGFSGRGVYGEASGASGRGVYGEAPLIGVFGKATGYGSDGVHGEATGDFGRGVRGTATDSGGIGIYGEGTDNGDATNFGGRFVAWSKTGVGVYGWAPAFGNSLNYGGFFIADGYFGRGVYGKASDTEHTNHGGFFEAEGSTGRGVYGGASGASGRGVFGQATNTGDVTNYGGYFRADGKYGRGLYAEALGAEGRAVEGVAKDTGLEISIGVTGAAKGTNSIGVGGNAAGTEGIGVLGETTGTSGHAVKGVSLYSSGYAGYFDGKGYFSGYLEKAGGGFKIDHPREPENKYLNHSFVESPDMMNIYNGNVVLNNNGEAWVELPDWFETLNRDFRYQLTCIGGFAQIYIAEKVSNNRFKIAGGQPNMEISWQVTGIRQDPWANANRLPVEEDKTEKELGYYMHPVVYGQSEENGIEWARNPERMRLLKEEKPISLESKEPSEG